MSALGRMRMLSIWNRVVHDYQNATGVTVKLVCQIFNAICIYTDA